MFEQVKKNIWDWAERMTSRPSAKKWLYALSFAESSFFPIPTDFFLMPIVAREPVNWLRITLWTGAMSVAGGLLGYIIGAGFFEVIGRPIAIFYNIEEQITFIGEAFNNNVFITIITAAFTPIPYKAFTIAAGLFRVDIIPFIIASALGRFARFFIVAYIMKRYGTLVGQILFKYFNLVTVFCAVIAVGYLVWRVFF